MDASSDAVPAVKKLLGGGGGGGGGGGVQQFFFFQQKKLCQSYKHGVGISSYMTGLSDKQVSPTQIKNGTKGEMFEPSSPPPPNHGAPATWSTCTEECVYCTFAFSSSPLVHQRLLIEDLLMKSFALGRGFCHYQKKNCVNFPTRGRVSSCT